VDAERVEKQVAPRVAEVPAALLPEAQAQECAENHAERAGAPGLELVASTGRGFPPQIGRLTALVLAPGAAGADIAPGIDFLLERAFPEGREPATATAHAHPAAAVPLEQGAVRRAPGKVWVTGAL
jgi:hypothetical protein